MYELVDLGFSFFYICELVVNMYTHWFWDFLQSWWNLFDFVVVSTSVCSQKDFFFFQEKNSKTFFFFKKSFLRRFF